MTHRILSTLAASIFFVALATAGATAFACDGGDDGDKDFAPVIACDGGDDEDQSIIACDGGDDDDKSIIACDGGDDDKTIV